MRIAIIGGGIYGCSLAYYLSELTGHDIHLYDKGTVGGVSTARSAGIVRHHYSDSVQVRLAKRGRELLQELEVRHGQDTGLRQNGYLILGDAATESLFRDNVAMQQRAGVDVELLSPTELSSMHPAIDEEDVAVAALETRAGFADPYLAASSFATCARENDVEIHTGTPVTDIHREQDQVTAIETAKGKLFVDLCCNAAGPWAADVAAMAGVDLPLKAYEAKIAVLQSNQSYDIDLPTVSDIGIGLYAKPEPGGDFIVGGMERRSDSVPLDSPQDTEGVTTADLQWVSEAIEKRLPGFADASIVETWSGPITAPPDWHQLVGRPDMIENFLVVAGGSGHGFKEAPAFTESIARSIADIDPVVDLSPYHPHRFRIGNQFESGYEDGSRS